MGKRKGELLAFTVLVTIIVGLPTMAFGYERLHRRGSDSDVRTFELTAQAPESGGWQPERITVRQGDPVRIRIHGADVVHGFAIGRIDIEPVVVYPGEVVSVEFTADEAGLYTFYCNMWCSPYHYRMRGELEVLAPDGTLPLGSATPTERHLNEIADQVDEPHPAQIHPGTRPSADAGASIAQRYVEVLSRWQDAETLRSHSPSDVYGALHPLTPDLASEERWDLIAHLWFTATTEERLATGRELYEANCAACHGLDGAGDGSAWRYLEDEPQSFADASTMAGGTGWIYYAKTARGGMGTGMPYFGRLFTEDEMWSVVDYLWTFLFEYEDSGGDTP